MTYLLISFIIIIPFWVYPENLLGPIKNEYILKNYLLIFLFLGMLICSLKGVLKTRCVKIKNTDKLVFLYLFFCCFSWIANKMYFFPEQLLLTIIYCCLFLFLSHSRHDFFKASSITVYWRIGLFLTCIYGVYQFLTHMQVSSTLGNRNFFACFIVSGMPFLTLSLIKDFRKKSGLVIVDILLILMSVFNLYFTKSRAAWIILSIQVVFLIYIFVKRKILFLSVLFLVIITIIFVPKTNNLLKRQIQGDVRPFIWQATCQMIAEYPFLGLGTGNFYLYYPKYRIHEYFLLSKSTDTTKHAHNEFLEVWAETGSLGFFSFMGLFIVLGINIVNYKKKEKLSPFILAVIVSCLSIGLHNCVDVNMRYTTMSVLFWMNLGILASFFDSKTLNIDLPVRISKIKIPVWAIVACAGIYLVWRFVVTSFMAEVNFQKGVDSKDKKDYEKAQYYYEKSLSYNRTNPSLLYHYGYLLDLKGLTGKSIEIYKEILKLAPYYAVTRKNLATCYLKQGRFQEAVKEYNIQLLLNPYDPDVYLNSAYCYGQLGLHDKAVLSHQKALETYQLIAERLISDGHYEKAISYLSTAVQVDSSNRNLVMLLVKSYVKNGRKENARELADIFLRQYPQDEKYVERLKELLQ